jgi:uncharacterized membrane protein
MMTGQSERLINDYLDRLASAGAALPAGRRRDLVAEIRTHIEDALQAEGAADEVTVRTVLERVGTPEEIVAMASGVNPEPKVVRGRRETVALVVLAVGGFIPVVGWAVGVVLALSSGAWSRHDKKTGILIGLVPALVLGAIFVATGTTAAGLGPLELFVLAWGFVNGLLSAAYLAYRLAQPDNAADEGVLYSVRASSV